MNISYVKWYPMALRRFKDLVQAAEMAMRVPDGASSKLSPEVPSTPLTASVVKVTERGWMITRGKKLYVEGLTGTDAVASIDVHGDVVIFGYTRSDGSSLRVMVDEQANTSHRRAMSGFFICLFSN